METSVENPGSYNDFKANAAAELDERQVFAEWNEALIRFRQFVTRDVEVVPPKEDFRQV